MTVTGDLFWLQTWRKGADALFGRGPDGSAHNADRRANEPVVLLQGMRQKVACGLARLGCLLVREGGLFVAGVEDQTLDRPGAPLNGRDGEFPRQMDPF